MPTEISTEGTKPQVVRIEAIEDEVIEVWIFDKDDNFIGTEWRLKEPTP